MNPGEKQQPEPKPQNLEHQGDQMSSEPPVFSAQRPKTLRTLVIVIIALLLILAGLLGWLLWRDNSTGTKQTSSTSSSGSETAATCPDHFSLYANTSLGVEFCYPDVWGDVEVSDAKFDASDSGSRWLFSFSNKPSVHAGVVSEDWSTTAARGGTCSDPAVQITSLPEEPSSTDWEVETTIDTAPPQPSSASRMIETEDGKHLIREIVNDTLYNGACLEAFVLVDNQTYPVVAASYSAAFNGMIASPQQHIDEPNTLISELDRADFATFVKSIKAYKE